MIPFVWLLLGPLSKLLAPFIKVVLVIGLIAFVDVQAQLGITDWAISFAEQWLKNQILGDMAFW